METEPRFDLPRLARRVVSLVVRVLRWLKWTELYRVESSLRPWQHLGCDPP